MMYTDEHKYFLRYFMHQKMVSVVEAQEYLSKILNAECSERSVDKYISEINSKIIKEGFSLKIVTCEINGQKYIVWVDIKTNDSSAKSESAQLEWPYLRKIVNEILHEPKKYVKQLYALRLSDKFPVPVKKNAANLIEKWGKEGYLSFQGDFVYLGARFIAEFEQTLKNDYSDFVATCVMCNNLVVDKIACKYCKKKFHKVCLNNHLENFNTCPNCMSPWAAASLDDTQVSNESDSD